MPLPTHQPPSPPLQPRPISQDGLALPTFTVNSSSLQSFGTGPLSPDPNSHKSKGLWPLGLNTLARQFTALVGLNTILALVGLAVSVYGLNEVSTNFNTVISSSAPSITAAQQLGQAFEDADAKAADYQLAARLDVSSPDFNPKIYGEKGLLNQAWNSYQQHRREIDQLLFQARRNITYPGEAETIAILTDRFLDYNARIAIMRWELEHGHREASFAIYKSAHDLLVGNLNNVTQDHSGHSPEEQAKLAGWPNFELSKTYLGIEANLHKLAEINRQELNKAAQVGQRSIGFATLLTLVTSLSLLASLGFLCLRWALVTHRLVNPAYSLAFLLALITTTLLLLSLARAAQDYKTVAVDSFISIDAAAEARQLATDANADESRLLLSPEGVGLDSTSPALNSEVRKAFQGDGLADAFQKNQLLLRKQLEAAWKNVTYQGERSALCQITASPLSSYTCPGSPGYVLEDYLKLDRQMRDLFKQNLLAAAIELDTGRSNETFGKLDSALQELSKVNETEFDRSGCSAIGQSQFGGDCKGGAYLPLLQIGVFGTFPLIMVAVLSGFLYYRKEF